MDRETIKKKTRGIPSDTAVLAPKKGKAKTQTKGKAKAKKTHVKDTLLPELKPAAEDIVPTDVEE